MNLEVEAYVGELAELRARELKLANLLTVVEEHLQGGWNTAGNVATGKVTERMVERELQDPDIVNWLHKMREHRGARHKRIM